MKSTNFRYRKDIDGLRALAIIPVVLFHAGVAGFSGGYVGVDIFFVISGYLITSIIYRDLVKNRFSFIDFYKRRVLRLLPPLLAMLLVVTPLSYFLLTYPNEFERYGGSLFAQGLFLANIYFLRNTDYFAAPGETYPLLHTWTLSVEEQFYLLFPFLFFVLYRYFNSLIGKILLVAGALSFVLCVYLSVINPNGVMPFHLLDILWNGATNSTVAFYVLFTRAWELIIGALIAVFMWAPKKERTCQVLGFLGLTCILISVFLFNYKTLFPGYAALLPTVGAALIIVSASNYQTHVSKLLSSRFLVWVGLISYSLYLWHWPIFVFGKTFLKEVNWFSSLLLILLAFLAASVSYKFIEHPFRKSTESIKNVMVLSLLLVSLIFVTYGFKVKNEEIKNSKDYDFTQALFNDENKHDFTRCGQNLLDDSCDLGNKEKEGYDFVLWGDSHAAMFFTLLHKIATEKNLHGRVFSQGDCIPIIDNDLSKLSSQCQKLSHTAFSFISNNNIKVVILGIKWDKYTTDTFNESQNNRIFNQSSSKTDTETIKQGLPATLQKLEKNGSQVYVLRQVPYQDRFDNRKLYYQSVREGYLVEISEVSRDEYLSRRSDMDSVFSDLDSMGITVIDPIDIFCSSGLCIIEKDGVFLYSDNNHLTTEGSSLMYEFLLEEIDFNNLK